LRDRNSERYVSGTSTRTKKAASERKGDNKMRKIIVFTAAAAITVGLIVRREKRKQ
jgi:hypothetical protein